MTLLKPIVKPLAPNVRITDSDGRPTKEFHEFLTRLDAWLGRIDIPVVPPLPPEPPADGGEYVRLNGVWRLKTRRYPATGNVDIVVPDTAMAANITALLYSPSSNQSAMRWSVDGTTFPATATDYLYSGDATASGSASWIRQAITSGSAILLANINDNPSLPVMIEMFHPVAKLAGGVHVCQWRSSSFNSGAAVQYTQWRFQAYTNTVSLNAVNRLKAIRIFPLSVTWSAGSWVNVEWIY